MSSKDRLFDALVRAGSEEARFFSSDAKPERERWVVAEFLGKLGVAFCIDELASPPESDPVDVSFRTARFQIKELFDPAEKRGDIKKTVALARSTRSIDPFVAPAAAHDIVLVDLAEAIHAFAAEPRYAPPVRARLDLLVYVTRPYAGFNEDPQRAAQRFAQLGWRSICCLFGTQALLLVSTSSSPEFLRTPWSPA